jgi:two-component system cell cycle sensor histidine kinase/response regulator CckA
MIAARVYFTKYLQAPDLKMIFVSGNAEEAFQKNLPPGGQFAFLPKPFTLKQLVATVKETMAGE